MGCAACNIFEKSHELASLQPLSLTKEGKRDEELKLPNVKSHDFIPSVSKHAPIKRSNDSSENLQASKTSNQININANVQIILQGKLDSKTMGIGSQNSLKISPLNVTLTTSLFRKENKHSIYQNYEMLNILGKGSFGEVKRARFKANGEIRAVKIIGKQFCIENDSMIAEIKALKELDHPNILKLYEFYQDAKYFYLVTEYCSGKELFDKIVALKHFSEMRAAKIIQQILSAVVYCHNLKICHRDLKPENLLLEEDSIDSNIKVIDFGTSKFCKFNERMKEKYGTPYYIAPEVIKKDYNMKCDIWSCGVILFIMLSGHPPFGGKTNEEIMSKVVKGNYNFARKEWQTVSESAKDLVKKMLTYNPAQRISGKEALDHVWIKQYTKINESKEEMLSSLGALNRFRLGQNLQTATLTFFACQMQCKVEESTLRKQFKALDKNNDGILSEDELINGFYEQYKDINKAEAEVRNIISQLDINKDGSINYTEFLMAHMKTKDIITNEMLRTAFNAFDLDNNGQITKDELQEVLHGTAVNDEEIWDKLISEADTNHDGQISFEEFKQMMLNYASDNFMSYDATEENKEKS